MSYLNKIKAVSYAGKPKSNTAMFLSAKAGKLLTHLKDVNNCLIFAEHGLEVPDDLLQKHHFEFSSNPQLAYFEFTKELVAENNKTNKNRKYSTLENGSIIGENVRIGDNVTIEPFVFIEHDCSIGSNSFIGSGSVIKRTKIADYVHIAENAVIGADGFNLVRVDDNLVNLPTLGKVIISQGAYIGSNTVVSAGLAGETRILEYAQIDADCHIHHDCQLDKNTTICSNVTMGGFVHIGEDSFIGIGAQIKNRITIGKNTIIGMGSVVIRNVEDNKTVYGNPAKIGN